MKNKEKRAIDNYNKEMHILRAEHKELISFATTLYYKAVKSANISYEKAARIAWAMYHVKRNKQRKNTK